MAPGPDRPRGRGGDLRLCETPIVGERGDDGAVGPDSRRSDGLPPEGVHSTLPLRRGRRRAPRLGDRDPDLDRLSGRRPLLRPGGILRHEGGDASQREDGGGRPRERPGQGSPHRLPRRFRHGARRGRARTGRDRRVLLVLRGAGGARHRRASSLRGDHLRVRDGREFDRPFRSRRRRDLHEGRRCGRRPRREGRSRYPGGRSTQSGHDRRQRRRQRRRTWPVWEPTSSSRMSARSSLRS